ncbi:MAG: 4Fe-4S dicluster domain-containing protein [bacterium]
MDKLTIDGVEVEPNPSKTVLEVATELGIEIPTLCYYRALSPYGACRLCVVEVTSEGNSMLQPACTFPAQGGEIRTGSEMVMRARKLLLELYLDMAPKSEVIQKLAKEYGVETTRMKVNANKSEKETDLKIIDDDKCIGCGLCVRVCKDLMHVGAIGFKGRGSSKTVVTPFGAKSEVCVTCGACVEICPTNAIVLEKITDWKPIPQLSEFNMGLQRRPSIYIPFPQAVPKVPVIDERSCMYFFNGSCKACEKFCDPNAIQYESEENEIELNVGTIVIATGFEPFDAGRKPELAYTVYPNVITGIEFERLVAASGPTGGKIVIDGKTPKRVVFIQCVGSRDKNLGNAWCSRVCCMYATKQAHLVKEKIPDAQVTVLYMDMRAFGKGFEEFYDRVRAEGVIFRRANGSEIYRKGEGLVVRTEDTLLGKTVEVEADLVVLSAGLEPGAGSVAIAKLLKLSRSTDGFLMEAHPKLRPVDTATDGVYLAGCCQSPKDIPDTVAQAKAAAASAIIPMVRGKVFVEPINARVDEDVCCGCRVCESMCEYKATVFDEEKGVMTVNAALCKGCGSCGGACPTGAMSIIHYTDGQIFAQLESLTEIAVE